MSRIEKAFDNKKAFIGYVMGGDPNLEKTEEFIMRLIDAGTDLVEIGVPFSDPIAEGPVIQRANIRALAVNTRLKDLFGLVARLRLKTDTPFVFLTYLNPVFRYGYDRFFEKCAQSGVDGVIIPDLPFEEQEEVLELSKKRDVDLISLVAPTSQERIKKIAERASGFLYMVSSMGVTGLRREIKTDLAGMARLAKSVTDIPVAIGFGVHTPRQAKEMSEIADGVIIGSAIVKLIEEHGEKAGDILYNYAKNIKRSM
ncbi:MAG: tryptophan synthase subunit alpha [Clostridiales bacterium]|jgi:tryptophan synthase alpha chain|nr:tryptophan synthase subunit alpha [Clostridiales bacterium]